LPPTRWDGDVALTETETRAEKKKKKNRTRVVKLTHSLNKLTQPTTV